MLTFYLFLFLYFHVFACIFVIDNLFIEFYLFSRPGILILINENDWELEGGLDAPLLPNDTILFISTLHGG